MTDLNLSGGSVAISGTGTVTLGGNGTGSSGLGNTNLTSQTVSVTGQVNYFADPVFSLQSGVGTVTMNSATVFTLNLGQVMQNSGTLNAMLALRNFLHDATFQDSLGGTFDLTSVNDFILTGFNPFSGVASGGAINPSIAFNTAMPVGTYTDTLFLMPTSANASGTSSLTSIQLNLQADIVNVPEPASWAMILAGAAILGALQRFRRRSA
ncbi:MAG: PEP-CTERM sorting domain-containing protein [Verrucomicrobiota bacterium]|nr:PEP-CTERM sorting domain-containing protein [Verrucomicrobiota bacterium]